MSMYHPIPNYYRDTVPYTSSDIGEPVPGWGTTVRIAGPTNVGIGALSVSHPSLVAAKIKPEYLKKLTSNLTTSGGTASSSEGGSASKDTGPDEPLPWWLFPLGAAAAMGALGWYGTKKGWF